MVLEVLKYVLIVLGIVVVGAFIIYALANLVLAIVDPHGRNKKVEEDQKQIPYENLQQKLLTTEKEQPVQVQNVIIQPTTTPVNEQTENALVTDVKDVDLEQAKKEEEMLSQEIKSETEQELDLSLEENDQQEELDLDEITVETKEEVVEEDDEDDDDEDIEALINKILSENNIDEDIEEVEESDNQEIKEEISEDKQEEVEEQIVQEEKVDDNNEKIKELEEALARQKEEYENKLAEAEAQKEQLEKDNEAKSEALNNERIEELENKLAQAHAEKEALLQEKQDIIKANEEKPVGPTLSLEEYEERLEVLRERLKVNEKELKNVKKEYIPLSKIKKTLEKDKTKLRRKENVYAKQKIVLYGVNNIADIDEEKLQKLSEDHDLIKGLRLSVEHCEEILKENEERYPILENSYNILLTNNENLKNDIEDCLKKIEDLKQED